MTRQHEEISDEPAQWSRLLWEHQEELETVQLLWRWGSSPYRPLVPEHMDPDHIRDHEWDRYEREETNILWELRDIEDPEARQQAIQELVRELWVIAYRWTQLRGSWCDFRLIGIGAGEQELISSSRRCRPSRTHARDWDAPTGQSAAKGAEPTSLHEVHSTHTRNLESVLDFTRSQRDDAAKRANKSLADSHLMWAQLNDAMRDVGQMQREQMELSNSMRSGTVDLRARAFAQLQETQRVKTIVSGVQTSLEALLGTLVPLTDRLIESFGGDRVVATETFPQFERAQQAMRYLALTLSNTQLELLFKQAPTAKVAGEGMRDTLREAGNMDTEIAALARVSRLLLLLRSDTFRDIATPTQQMCATYIIGRMAFYKIATGNEDN